MMARKRTCGSEAPAYSHPITLSLFLSLSLSIQFLSLPRTQFCLYMPKSFLLFFSFLSFFFFFPFSLSLSLNLSLNLSLSNYLSLYLSLSLSLSLSLRFARTLIMTRVKIFTFNYPERKNLIYGIRKSLIFCTCN